jgi:hypothetical protein
LVTLFLRLEYFILFTMFCEVEFTSDQSLVCAIFGVQRRISHGPEGQANILKTLDSLLRSSADHHECFQQTNGDDAAGSIIWITYWSSTSKYESWWKSNNVDAFWCSLPDDAGVWREVMHVQPPRFQFGTNQDRQTGISRLGNLKESERAGFWGSYRARVPDSKHDRFITPLPKMPARSERSPNHIRRGRVKVTSCPENVCFVREGQDNEEILELEQSIWNRDMDKHAQAWFEYLGSGQGDSGMLSMRTCHGVETPELTSAKVQQISKTTQFGFFLDLGHLERVARSHKRHLSLRDELRRHYCPMGQLNEGRATIWVEMCILKRDGFEAEYVGCYDGTGFSGLENNEAFSRQSSGSKPRLGGLILLFVALAALIFPLAVARNK